MSHSNSFVSSASKVSPLQLRATQRFSFHLAMKELQISIVSASVLCSVRKNRFRATSQLLPLRTRVARNPSAKNFVFASGPPSYRPGEARGATSLELRPVVPLPSLAQTHMFFGGCKAQRLLTSLNGAASARHQPSPKGNPRLLSSTCCYSKTQCSRAKAKSFVPLLFSQEFADNVASPPNPPF